MRAFSGRASARFVFRLFPAVALILGGFLLAGCGETVIDASKAEDTIQANLEKSFDEKVTSVECPSGQEVEVGKTFTCAVDFSNGKHATVTLKIRNQDADTDLVGYKPTK